MFETPFCKIEYLPDLNAVLCSWKAYCEGDDYRAPLVYGLQLIHEKSAATWITDTSKGFQSRDEDNVWLATEFTPQAIESSCQNIVFIISDDSPLQDEIALHSQILEHAFNVRSVTCLQEI